MKKASDQQRGAEVEAAKPVSVCAEQARRRQAGRHAVRWQASMMRGSCRVSCSAGFAIGDGGQHRIGEIVAHLGEGQRQDGEVDARPPEAEEADDEGEQAGKKHGEDEAGMTSMVSSLNDHTAV
jgi:hypothetical protein